MTSSPNQPLGPDDVAVDAERQAIRKQDGTPIADAGCPAVAADIADRLNQDEARREEGKWSA
jgi:hypothetical protein